MTESPDTSAIQNTPPLARWLPDRAANAAWGALFAAPLVLARMLKPSAEGMGTHRQLGLPPCTFLWMTGFPCPFCGMTTSWSHAAHGDVITSIRTQPMGFVLFLIAALLAVRTLASAATGGERFRLERVVTRVPKAAWWSGLAALCVAWIYKSALVRGWI